MVFKSVINAVEAPVNISVCPSQAARGENAFMELTAVFLAQLWVLAFQTRIHIVTILLLE